MRLRGLPVLAGLLLGLAACDRPEPSRSAAGAAVSVARYNWPGSYWVDVAEARGWFADAGLDARIVDTNSDYFASLHDVAEGRLDCQGFTVFDFVRSNMEGADLVMVAATDDSWGADVLVAAPGIANLAALRGRRIGVTRGTYCEYLLTIALDRAHLALDDVILVAESAERMPQLLSEGRADAVITWEPYATQAQNAVRGERLFDTAGETGLASSGIVFRREMVDSRPDVVQATLDVWVRASLFVRVHPRETAAIVARAQKVPVGEVEGFASSIRLLEPRQSLARFSYETGFASLHGEAAAMSRFLVRSRVANGRFDSLAHFDPRFLRANLGR